MWLPACHNSFKMVVIFCMCCVMVFFLSFYTDYYGVEPRNILGSSSMSSIRSKIGSHHPQPRPFPGHSNQTTNSSSTSSQSELATNDSYSATKGNSSSSSPNNPPNEQGGNKDASVVVKITDDAEKPKVNPVTMTSCINYKDLPNEKITPRKDPTTLDIVNAELLGKSLSKVEDALQNANTTLPGILMKRQSIQEAVNSIDQTLSEMNLAVDVDDYQVLPGGHWIPVTCKPIWKVAIVIPFRNRFEHLPIFLRHIVPLLKKQKLEFSIFISEQRNDIRFNRAMLMNVGFVEALNFTKYDCVVFHDIDHMALNVQNYYGCDKMPKHFISGERIWNWKIIYEALFGGVTGLTTSQFYTINGLPNAYWGWGGEDDDFAARVKAKGLTRTRPEGEIGYFDTIDHKATKSNPQNTARFCLLNLFKQRMDSDGVSNLKYEAPIIELHPLYTNVSTNIQRLKWNNNWTPCQE